MKIPAAPRRFLGSKVCELTRETTRKSEVENSEKREKGRLYSYCALLAVGFYMD